MTYTILDVIDSVINWQHQQAARQFIEWKLTFKEFDEYRLSDMPWETAKLADHVVNMYKISASQSIIDVSEELKELKSLQESGDTEWAHSEADLILCNVLTKLWYNELVEEYDKVSKRYA